MAARLRALPLLLLAGCAAPAEEATHALQAALASSQQNLIMLAAAGPAGLPPHPSRPAPPRQSAGTEGPLPGGRPSPSPAPGALGPSPSAPGPLGPVSAAQLLGAPPETLRRWLGEPGLRRAEGSAEVWLYAAEACALDLVFYRDGGALRVAHAAARASGAQPTTEDGCLRALAAGAPARPLPAASSGPPPGLETPGA